MGNTSISQWLWAILSCTKISIFVKRILLMWPPKQWPVFEAGVTTMHCAHCSRKYSLKTQEAGKCGIKRRLPSVSRTLCMHILIPIISDLDRLVLCDIRRSISTIKAKWCNFVWRKHENMSPCTGSRVNTNHERIASWGGCQCWTGDPRILETPLAANCCS